jgi:hypothetical protein
MPAAIPAFLALWTVLAAPSHEQSVLVQRAHWPVIVNPAIGRRGAAEICSRIGPQDIELSLDGAPLEVTAIGPRPLPRTHALLIDASPSMLERLRAGTRFEEAKKAAAEYIDAVPEGDAVLVASFNESLVLGTAPTTDKEAARRAVQQLRTGFFTALWDSLGYLVSYLDGIHGEKVVVLLSDGEDEGSYEWKSFEGVVERAAAARHLSIFPIGLGVSMDPRERSRYHLGALARRTGGEFFEIREGERLGQLFRRVLQRLERRLYIAYVPPPERSGGKISVRQKKGVPCKIVSLGSSEWLDDGTAGDALARELLAPSESKEAIRGRIDDLLVGSGPLFDRSVYEKRGKLRVDLTSEPRTTAREIVISTPPLSVLRSRLTGPGDLLLYMLEEGFGTREGKDRPLFMVHGRTFLKLRGAIGRAMFASREDYRGWAAARVAKEVERELPMLLAGRGEESAHLRGAMVDRAADPASGRPQGHLSSWLGDLPVTEVVSALELRIIRSVLDGAGAPPAIERTWHRLGEWFPPAIDARIVTPLVPVYVAEREAIGFYRFVLPAPRAHGRQSSPLPPMPLALMAVRRVMQHPEAADLLAGRLRPVDLRYGGGDARANLRRGCRSAPAELSGGARIELSLSQIAAGDEQPLRLVAYFGDSPGDGAEPLCLWFEGGGAELAMRLNGLLSGSSGGPL